MTWVAVAIGGSALVNAYMQNRSANRAAEAQTAAGNQANDLQWRMYDQNRTDQAPWREAGGWSLSQLRDLLGPGGELRRQFSLSDFNADPGYQFRLEQGGKALERSAAARGGVLGGGTLRALTRYNSGVASDEYGRAFDRFNINQGNTFNRLASLAGVGQQSVNQTGQYGMNTANQVGQNILGMGNARAAAEIASGNAWGNAINGLGNAWQYYTEHKK